MAHGLLTEAEDEIAASRGWGLFLVYDWKKARWIVQIGPPLNGSFKAPHNNVDAFNQFVVKQAQAGDALSKKAIQLVMQGVAVKKKKP